MRYAIFSDVHANQQAWQAVLADAFEQRAGTLVCLGDVVGYGPKPLEVLNAVREVTPNFVLGNHDAAACGRLDPSIFNDRARSVIEWTREQLDDEARMERKEKEEKEMTASPDSSEDDLASLAGSGQPMDNSDPGLDREAEAADIAAITKRARLMQRSLSGEVTPPPTQDDSQE